MIRQSPALDATRKTNALSGDAIWVRALVRLAAALAPVLRAEALADIASAQLPRPATTPGSGRVAPQRVPAAAAWHRWEFVFAVPADVTTLRPTLTLTQPGELIVDRVALERLP
jgi:hypothetical protein